MGYIVTTENPRITESNGVVYFTDGVGAVHCIGTLTDPEIKTVEVEKIVEKLVEPTTAQLFKALGEKLEKLEEMITGLTEEIEDLKDDVLTKDDVDEHIGKYMERDFDIRDYRDEIRDLAKDEFDDHDFDEQIREAIKNLSFEVTVS